MKCHNFLYEGLLDAIFCAAEQYADKIDNYQKLTNEDIDEMVKSIETFQDEFLENNNLSERLQRKSKMACFDIIDCIVSFAQEKGQYEPPDHSEQVVLEQLGSKLANQGW